MGTDDIRTRARTASTGALALAACLLVTVLSSSARAALTTLTFAGSFNLTTTPSNHTYFIWFDYDLNVVPVDGFAKPLGDLAVGNHNFSFTQSISTTADSAAFGIFGETGAGTVVFSVPTSVATSAISGSKTFAQIFPDAPAEQTIHDQLAADTYSGQSLAALNAPTELQFFNSDPFSLQTIDSNLISRVQNLQFTSLSGTVLSASTAQNNGTAGYSITPAPEPSAIGLLGATMLLSLRRPRR